MKKVRDYEPKIRTKIMLLYLILSIVLIVVGISCMFVVVSRTMNASLDNIIDETLNDFENNISVVDEQIVINNIDELEQKLLHNGGIFIRVVDEEGNIIYESHGAEEVFEWIIFEKEWRTANRMLELDGERIEIQLVGNIFYNSMLRKLAIGMIWFIPIYLAITAILTYNMAKMMLKPIAQITHTTREIKNGNWKGRIEGIKSKDEIGELASEFNEMISEIDKSYTREKRFTSDASHELRTPLSIVGACAEEALNTDNSEIIRENLETIQQENARMSKIISQLLTLSRGYEGRLSYQPEELELYSMVESVVEMLDEQINDKNIIIHNEIDKNAIVNADQGMYSQILINIIGNAIKYGKEGGNIYLRHSRDNRYSWIEIEDDGIGISKEDINHIFERFYRADAARNRDGSGLGLSIVKWMVDIHNGEIKVTSKLGEGTLIKIGI